jgi:hypothetical protein
MTTTTPDPAFGMLVPAAEPLFTVNERQALAGYLSGYSGLTRDAYTLDLRQYTTWCTPHGRRSSRVRVSGWSTAPPTVRVPS